jgi:hypothetical protein
MDLDNLLTGDAPQGRTRETDIRRDAGRRWWKGEERIDHPNLVRSFDGWIDRAEDGRFCLRNDINWAYIGLEGPAYFVESVRVHAAGVTLMLSGAREEELVAGTLRQDAHGALWCDVREGRCPARFENHASSALAALLDEDEAGVLLRVGGRVCRPPLVADGAAPLP